MKLIVIGSKGFIGSHVMDFYTQQAGVQVWGCDVVTDYAAGNYFQIDATNADFELPFEEHQYDVCINCSGAASVPDSFQHTSRDFALNVLNVQRILESIRKHQKHCRFLNLSSAAVYGNPASLPVSEDMPLHPLSPYGWHKLYAEQLGSEYHRFFNIPTSSVRIFSAYGPGLKKQLFWDWHKKIKETGELHLLGTGRESRDFIFVTDVVRAIHQVTLRGSFAGEAINVGNGTEISIAGALEVFRQAYQSDFRFTFSHVTREGDPLNWAADTKKLKSLGYVQACSLEEGLKQYISWLRKLE